MTQQIITVAALILAAGCVAWQLRDFVRLCKIKRKREKEAQGRVITMLMVRLTALENEVMRIRKEFALDTDVYVGKEKKNG